MKEKDHKDLNEDFEGYEEARIEKPEEDPKTVGDKEVEAANKWINPDENTRDRG
ncbi:MAG: hypothetical protein E6767_02620 [Dysgonomonas sp.]|nr:hypothetical protein [Dysgonomonas sp.]